MADTLKINLCRALKLKNRLASRLARLDSLITEYNSSVEDNREYDVRQLYKTRMVLAEHLVQLKVQITDANRPMQRQIFEVAECKSLCSTLSRVDTQHGPRSTGFGEPVQRYVAQFRKADLERETRKVEREIDRLQDELDQFNFKTRIEVPLIWLQDDTLADASDDGD